MTSTRVCEANNPATCRYHGKFNREYDAWVKEHRKSNVEPFIVFHSPVLFPVQADDTLLGGEKEDDGYDFWFAGNPAPNLVDSPDITIHIPGRTAKDYSYNVRLFLSNKNLEPELRAKYESILEVLKGDGLREVTRRRKMIQKAWDSPFTEGFYMDASSVKMIYDYGKNVELIPNLSDCEKATVLGRSVLKRLGLSNQYNNFGDYHDNVKAIWSIYSTYKDALKGISHP